MGIKFRKMLPEDASVVSEFEKRLFGTCTDEASYKKMCTDEENIYMAAEDNGIVIAYCAIIALYSCKRRIQALPYCRKTSGKMCYVL